MVYPSPETDPAHGATKSGIRSLTIEEDTSGHQIELFILESLVLGQVAGGAGKPHGESFIVNPGDVSKSQLGHRSKILVVEDHEPTQMLERVILEEAGYTVLVVASGEGLLEVLKREGPDLVLMDIGLNGMDGFTVCQRIRQGSQVPIMMVTGRDNIDDQVRALGSGADDYLTKSFLTQELATRVAVLLQVARSKGRLDDPMSLDTELDELFEGRITLAAHIYGSIRTAVEFVGKIREFQQIHGLRVHTIQRSMDISFRVHYPVPIRRLLLQWDYVTDLVLSDELIQTFDNHKFTLSLN
jgi:DNA-binding response OmpR family regulator